MGEGEGEGVAVGEGEEEVEGLAEAEGGSEPAGDGVEDDGAGVSAAEGLLVMVAEGDGAGLADGEGVTEGEGVGSPLEGISANVIVRTREWNFINAKKSSDLRLAPSYLTLCALPKFSV